MGVVVASGGLILVGGPDGWGGVTALAGDVPVGYFGRRKNEEGARRRADP